MSGLGGVAPKVTVIMATFNQREYVERAVRSIAMQRVGFPIEVLIGDDASTDGTRDVLRLLEGSLDRSDFHFLLREQNMGKGGERNNEDMLHRARGTYLALLEGDDFWTYDGKLQAQVDFLEEHADHVACYHQCQVVGADSRPNGERYPECPVREYSFREFFYRSLPGQLGTSLVRREPYRRARDEFMALARYDSYAGDRRNAFLMLCEGKVRCLPEVWGAYRHVVTGGSSYSATVRIDEDYARNELLFCRACLDYAGLRQSVEALDAAKLQYYRCYLKWSRRMPWAFSRSACLDELRREARQLRYRYSWVRWYAVLGLRRLLGRPVDL